VWTVVPGVAELDWSTVDNSGVDPPPLQCCLEAQFILIRLRTAYTAILSFTLLGPILFWRSTHFQFPLWKFVLNRAPLCTDHYFEIIFPSLTLHKVRQYEVRSKQTPTSYSRNRDDAIARIWGSTPNGCIEQDNLIELFVEWFSPSNFGGQFIDMMGKPELEAESSYSHLWWRDWMNRRSNFAAEARSQGFNIQFEPDVILYISMIISE
jgi:hypothetical protein